MFPTTVWTTLRSAGAGDATALEEFASSYRAPVRRWLRRRVGGDDEAAEDLAQEVFVRLLRGDVLAKADRARGRFRALLLTVASRTLVDRRRRDGRDAREEAVDDVPEPGEVVERDEDFDREWLEELVARSLERVRAATPGYAEVLEGHLAGERQDRQRLWIARGKLLAALRHEIALTCTSHAEVETETTYLAALLDSGRSAGDGDGGAANESEEPGGAPPPNP